MLTLQLIVMTLLAIAVFMIGFDLYQIWKKIDDMKNDLRHTYSKAVTALGFEKTITDQLFTIETANARYSKILGIHGKEINELQSTIAELLGRGGKDGHIYLRAVKVSKELRTKRNQKRRK